MSQKIPKMKKSADVNADACAHCGGRNPTNRCGRCGLVKYCSMPCQRAHWKDGGHKQACLAPEQRTLAAAQAAAPPRTPLAVDGDECAICLDPLSLATAANLPCGHVFHPACVERLRSFGVNQFCPMCRTELPPGPEKLFDEAVRLYVVINLRVERGEASWSALTVEDQKQIDEVREMWTQAARQGLSGAEYNLGVMYAYGQGVTQSDEEAARWNIRGAENGNARAQYNLGLMYDQGRGLAQSDVEAVRWYRKAADQGHIEAQYNTGCMYHQGRGVAQSDNEAARWHRKAADQGDAQAQSNLAQKYLRGRGVAQSDEEAKRWFLKAADQGDIDAQYSLGDMCHQGRGVAQSVEEALRWWRKAADQGDAQAQYNLGVMSHIGQGLQIDFLTSQQYLTLAAAQGHKRAKAFLIKAFPERAPATKLPSMFSSAASCAYCGVAAANLKACTRCRRVVYCGRDCQVAHWKAGHKKGCCSLLANGN